MKKLVLAVVLALAVVSLFAVTAAPAFACDSCGYEPCCCCTYYSPGYWVNHPDAWPVDTITLLNGETFTQAQAIAWMRSPVVRDKRVTMFRAMAAAWLNDKNGCPGSAALWYAQKWWTAFGGAPVPASSAAWQYGDGLCIPGGECIYLQLDAEWN